MPNEGSKKICFIFTKQFPFGIKESYLLDEVPFLKQYFDFIYFIPYAEFGFDKSQMRIKLSKQEKVIYLNEAIPSLSLTEKIHAAFAILTILWLDFFTSRERFNTFRRFYQNALRLYHYFACSRALLEYMRLHQKDQITFYHYWLHDGMIIQKFAQGIWRRNFGFTISRAHSLDLYHKNWPLKSYLPYESIKFRMADHVASISKHGLRHINCTFPDIVSKFSYRPLGVIDVTSGKLDYTLPQPLILSISWISELKRLDRILELMTELPREFKWVHIGNGDVNILNKLKIQCDALNIQFEAKGYLSKQEVYDFFTQNRVTYFCNMSVWEGVPVTLMEAAMFGIPMIVSNIDGNKEVVEHGQNGWIVEGENWPNELIAEIAEVAGDERKWMQRSKSARQTFVHKYNADQNYNEFYRFLLEKSAV